MKQENVTLFFCKLTNLINVNSVLTKPLARLALSLGKLLGRVCFVIFFFLLYTLPVAAQDVPAPKLVKVGWDNIPGLEDRLPDGTPAGYNYEYLSKIKQYTNWQFEFVFCTWTEMEEKLINGEIDIVGDVAKTPARMQKYNYSELPNGYSRMVMACRKDDNRFGYNDYPAFDGITVATIPSTFRKALLDREAKKHNFTVNYRLYPTEEAMFKGLNNKEADVAIFSNVTTYADYKVLSEWEPNPFYFIVNKSRSDILQELDIAMRKVENTDIFLQSRLFNKYFSNNEAGIHIAFSRDEMNYLADKPEITVLLSTSNIPISYVEQGKAKGVIVDYLSAIAARTGLRFRYILCANSTEMLARFKNGEGDIFSQLPDDFAYGEKLNVKLTQPYIQLNYGLVEKINEGNKIKTIAVIQGRNSTLNKLAELGQSFTIRDYPDTISCMDAVANNETNAAVIHSMAFDQLSYHAKYQYLHFHAIPSLNMNLCLGVSNRSNPNLFNILEKVASSLGNTTEAIATKYSSLPHIYTYRDYLTYGAPFLLTIIVLLLLVGSLLFWSKRQKRLSKQLSEAKLAADKANEAKSVFLSSVSHDMRTPLNGIIGFTDFALQANSIEEKQGFLKKIKIAGNLLLDLINDTLDLSRIESGKLILKPEPVDGKNFWASVTTALQPTAALKNIRFESDITSYPQETILVDQIQVKKVLLNLISNAIKYTPSGGHVSVAIQVLTPPEAGCNRRIIVEDDGIGMSKEFLSRIYEPFSQEQRSEALNVSGSGLGLSIVKRIVDMMHGRITVQSKLHEGTRFVVDLPIKICQNTDKKNALETGTNQQEAVIPANINILLCEDNYMNAEIAHLLLKNKAVQMDWAKDGEEGVNKFIASPVGHYAAILMDLRMPHMDGYVATKTIRKLNRSDAETIPIIAMSADAFEEDVQLSKAIGMNAYITKPIAPQIFYQTIAKTLKV